MTSTCKEGAGRQGEGVLLLMGRGGGGGEGTQAAC